MVEQSRSDAAIAGVERVLGGRDSTCRLVAGHARDAIEEFVVFPARGIPRLLLPMSRLPLRASIDEFLGKRRWSGLALALTSATTIAGLTHTGVSRKLSLLADNKSEVLRELFSHVLGRDDFHLALRLSFGRPNAKTVIAVISDIGETLCFAKVGGEQMTDDLVKHEHTMLQTLSNVDLPVICPRVLYFGAWGGSGHILITAPLKLNPLPSNARDAHRAADTLATAYPVDTSELRSSGYWEHVNARLDACEAIGAEAARCRDMVNKIGDVWGSETLDFGFSHGDWSRANVGLVAERVAAIDWERCSHFFPRGIDTAHFAIFDLSRRRRLDIGHILNATRRHLATANRPIAHAEALVVLDLLEMSIRILMAQAAGLRVDDSKFELALALALRSWAK